MLELKWFVRLSDFKVDVHSKPPSLEPASLPAATKRSKERAHSVDNVSHVTPVDPRLSFLWYLDLTLVRDLASNLVNMSAFHLSMDEVCFSRSF